ncbi:homoserine dehydrogenase [Sinomonas sp. ASV322]|nr:homoserine dehydrogenase [Sinomonas sp. ASV322]MDQ4501490.1 homoserine dehydrogenase [Sinomonas sp. ASV322]
MLKVALLGCGTVGSQVARILREDAEALAARSGARLELAGIAVRNPGAARDVELPRRLFTKDADALVDSADLVVELVGGIEPARSLILRAVRRGASVVTGNKALLAQDGPALFEEAARHGAELRFEAAVAGAIPIIRPMRESLSGDRITRVMGILNGTTNYILDQMDTTGAAFADALAEAQRLGYAEADPTADVEGHDAAAKAALLATLAFHTPVSLAEVQCEGITRITTGDIAAAQDSGLVIKLLAVAELGPAQRPSHPVATSRLTRGHLSHHGGESWPRIWRDLATRAARPGHALGGEDGETGDGGGARLVETGDGGGARFVETGDGGGARLVETGDGGERLSVRVHPTLLPREHPLAAVRGANNAVFVEADNAGQLMFHGAGAGGRPAASAVMGDLVSTARRIVARQPAARRRPPAARDHITVA